VALAGLEMDTARAEVGGPLYLAPVWQVEGGLPRDAVLFAGLFDAGGRRWAQADERPLGSLYPPAEWPPGGLVRTPLRLDVPAGTPPGAYRLEVGWYVFEEGQPRWLPWAGGVRLDLGAVDVAAPAGGWAALARPDTAYGAGVTLGRGVRLLGFDAPGLEARAGQSLEVDLYWQATAREPAPAPAVLWLVDGQGGVVFEEASAPAGGLAPFAGLAAGQVVRDPRPVALPPGLAPGVYDLYLGRRRPDGTWLPVARGPFRLGHAYPLATVRVPDRQLRLVPPGAEYPVEAQFGDVARLVGYDRSPGAGSALYYTLHWQALLPTDTSYKIFLHVVGQGGPADVRAQADVYPDLPTSAWLPGEYRSEGVVLEAMAGLPAGRYEVLVGLYEEATGRRLPVYDREGLPRGDSLLLEEIRVGE
jgi:hypothetical protein